MRRGAAPRDDENCGATGRNDAVCGGRMVRCHGCWIESPTRSHRARTAVVRDTTVRRNQLDGWTVTQLDRTVSASYKYRDRVRILVATQIRGGA